MKNLIRLIKGCICILLVWTIQPAAAQSDSLTYRAFFSTDSTPINIETELICQFVYPLKSGGMNFYPTENWVYTNLIPTAAGTKSFLLTRNDSLLYVKRQYHFYYRSENIGPAAIRNIAFRQMVAGKSLGKLIFFDDLNIKIVSPKVSESAHSRGWIIIILFLLMTALIITLFVSRRKKNPRQIPYTRKYITYLKNKLIHPANIQNDEIFHYFWELWEYHFHIDKSLAITPLDQQEIRTLGLTGRQVKGVEESIQILRSNMSQNISAAQRSNLLASLTLLIQIKEKQLY